MYSTLKVQWIPCDIMPRPRIEINDIFRQYGAIYKKKYAESMSLSQQRAMTAIQGCRTAILGGHIDECDNPECRATHISYNSCRNRHCPKCQSLPSEQWLLDRKNDLLPVNYFHNVFTLPDTLNNVIYSNQKICYNILFKSVSQTISELTKDPEYLGAEIGITAILHT